MHITKTRAASSSGKKTALNPTAETYETLVFLFDVANKELFEGRLPRPLFNFQRHGKSMGFLNLAKVENEASEKSDKITLNPEYLRDASTLDLMVVMVHLMIHMQQAYFGSPSRGGYHNREFASIAKSMGLYPSDTGEPEGKETGQHISHYIVDGGRFHRLAVGLENRGVRLRWREVGDMKTKRTIDGVESEAEGAGKSGKRVRFVCPLPHDDGKGPLAWGCDGLEISCTIHGVPMIPG